MQAGPFYSSEFILLKPKLLKSKEHANTIFQTTTCTFNSARVAPAIASKSFNKISMIVMGLLFIEKFRTLGRPVQHKSSFNFIFATRSSSQIE